MAVQQVLQDTHMREVEPPPARNRRDAPAGYAWNANTGRYERPDGRPVSDSQIRMSLDQLKRRTSQALQAQLSSLGSGEITFQQWQRRAKDTITHANIAAAALAVGGWNNVSERVQAQVLNRINTQMEFFTGFASTVRSTPRDERDTPAHIARAGLYGSSVQATYYDNAREFYQGIGATEEINILGVVLTSHCDECPELSDLAWVPIGTLPLVGERACFGNCKCIIEYRDPNNPTPEGASGALGSKPQITDKDNFAAAAEAWEGQFGDFNSEVLSITDIGQDQYRVDGWIHDDKRNTIGDWRRIVDNKNKIVEHDYLRIDEKAQGTGFANEFNKNAIDYYRRAGYKEIKIHANLDIGGYTWARQGFDFDMNHKGISDPEQEVFAIGMKGANFDFGDISEVEQVTGLKQNAPDFDQKWQNILSRVHGDVQKWLERWDKDHNTATAYELSQIGKDYASFKDSSGRTMWPGKLIMLDTDWHGHMRL